MELLHIGIIGDFDGNKKSHIATNDALKHSSDYLSLKIAVEWLPTKALELNMYDYSKYDAFWCAPGSPYDSYIGALNAILFARENDIPFIGTCGGFQHAVMEYAQNVLKISKIEHQEYNPDASEFFISALSCSLLGETKEIFLKKGSIIHNIYNEDVIIECYNCNFGLNAKFQANFDKNGFKVVGVDSNGEARILEMPTKNFYIATLFQPQLSSTPQNPHKLINRYLLSAKAFHNTK